MIRESDRIKNKLLALDLRLAELKMELQRTEIRVLQLEAEQEDTRMASLFGERPAGAAIGPQLDETRKQLAAQQALVKRVRDSQKETQVLYLLTRRREQTLAAQEEPPA